MLLSENASRARDRSVDHDAVAALTELVGLAGAFSLRCSRHLPMRDHRLYDLLAPLRAMNEVLGDSAALKRFEGRRMSGLVMHLHGAASVLAVECGLRDELRVIELCTQKALAALGNTSWLASDSRAA